MATRSKLTVRLPNENLGFLKRYAAEHGLTVTEVLDRYLTRLREGAEGRAIHPEVERISGLVPTEVDAEALYHEHLLDKHR
jgi:hypothetical protein